jgi:hypothetical protein
LFTNKWYAEVSVKALAAVALFKLEKPVQEPVVVAGIV